MILRKTHCENHVKHQNPNSFTDDENLHILAIFGK